ncbi:MAG: rhomboid family intramembrane serine protease [Mesorhizobium sp.]|nr:rhomboid family intramembrane serine protease [Mesorhizobium sp.]MBL8578908.1 rhomboid family intramembrane serine protease [Mesorhizobium sp.]
MTEQAPDARNYDQRKREPVFNLPAVVIAFIAICVGAFLVSDYVLDDAQYYWLILHGAFIPAFYSGEIPVDFYPVFGPVTYSLLHGSVAHLFVNMIWLAAFGSPLANRLGAVRFILFWIVTSIAAAGLHFAIYPTSQAPLIGASGAISGMMGAAARFGFRVDRSAGKPAFDGPVLPIMEVLRMRNTVAFLAVWMVINVVTGVVGLVPGEASQIAWEAHIGGFVVGFFFVALFDRRFDR